MTRPISRVLIRFIGALLLLPLASIASVEAACPNVCDCMGQAKSFSLVAEKLMVLQEATLNYYGYAQLIETYVGGDVCTPRLLASGPSGYGTFMYGALATNSKGTAASFRQKGPYQDNYTYGVQVDLLATGGGAVKGLANLDYYTLDTTGTHPRVGDCRQAILDMKAASETFAALPPTQVLGTFLVKDDFATIEAGPGVNVIDMTRMLLLPGSSYGISGAAILDIVTEDDTEAVIINTLGLVVGEFCQIYADDPTKVIINVVGPGPQVRISPFALADLTILAPERTATVGMQLGDFAVGGLMAKRVRLKGSTAYSTLDECP
jgi:hypothetical protein